MLFFDKKMEKKVSTLLDDVTFYLSVADPGFPPGGAANPPGGGERKHMILPNFPKNCMKLNEFGLPGGERPLGPFKSAPAYVESTQNLETRQKVVLCSKQLHANMIHNKYYRLN